MYFLILLLLAAAIYTYQASHLDTDLTLKVGCLSSSFSKWDSQVNSFERGGKRILRLPYSNLTLLQPSKDQSPTYHYTELFSYLKNTTIDQPIYI